MGGACRGGACPSRGAVYLGTHLRERLEYETNSRDVAPFPTPFPRLGFTSGHISECGLEFEMSRGLQAHSATRATAPGFRARSHLGEGCGGRGRAHPGQQFPVARCAPMASCGMRSWASRGSASSPACRRHSTPLHALPRSHRSATRDRKLLPGVRAPSAPITPPPDGGGRETPAPRAHGRRGTATTRICLENSAPRRCVPT
jgi:hypothetical protein